MRLQDRVVLLTCLLVGFALSPAAAKEEKILASQVPAKVAGAEKAKFPKAQITGIEKDEDNGKTTYEFGLKDGPRKWEASFTPDGTLVEVEETIAGSAAPAAVNKALQTKYPAAKILLVEKVTEGEGKTAKVFYEFKIQTKAGGREVKFDPAGKFISEEEKKGNEINN